MFFFIEHLTYMMQTPSWSKYWEIRYVTHLVEGSQIIATLCCMFLLMDKVLLCTVYPKKYAHGFCFAVLCCGYTLTDFTISIRLTSLALWQSNDCPSASKATLMNMDKYFMWIHCERLHNHTKAKHNKTVCIFLGIYGCTWRRYGMDTGPKWGNPRVTGRFPAQRISNWYRRHIYCC